MRILIASDLHANAQALDALPTDYDQLWILGDLVNYGPNPGAVVEFVRQHARVVVRGNHDHAIGCHADPRCSEPYRKMAEAMGRFTERELSNDDKEYLANLPLTATCDVSGSHFFLCHAIPSDPLFSCLGQPKVGRPQACYALWESGRITLHAVPYDYEGTISTIRALGTLGVTSDIKQGLIQVLKSGGALVSTKGEAIR